MKTHRPKLQEIKKLKATLLTKRIELLQTVAEIENDSLRADRTEQPRVSNHPAEMGADNCELENTVQLLETESRILQDIDRALDLIERGAYGRCEACRRAIPLKRLEAIPWARLCVECADALEKTPAATRRPAWRMLRYAW